MGVAPHQYSDHGFFYDLGIDSEDTVTIRGQWKMRKLSSIMRQLGHEGVRLAQSVLLQTLITNGHWFVRVWEGGGFLVVGDYECVQIFRDLI